MSVSQHQSMPREIARAKAQLPVAYVGMGILEWHGLHNVCGLDGVKADGVARYLADHLGGVVMPPLFWGDHRGEICELVFHPGDFPDLTMDHTLPICAHMGYDKQKLTDNAARGARTGGWRLWEELAVHMMFEMESFDFRCIVAIPGHYPLFAPLDRAIGQYRAQGGTADVYALRDYMAFPGEYSGDHAAKFETSIMMALAPEFVDLSRLDADLTKPNIGVMGDDPRTQACAEYGRAILERFLALVRGHLTDIDLI